MNRFTDFLTRAFLTSILLPPAAHAAITVSGLADKTKYANSVAFTITADPGAATTTPKATN